MVDDKKYFGILNKKVDPMRDNEDENITTTDYCATMAEDPAFSDDEEALLEAEQEEIDSGRIYLGDPGLSTAATNDYFEEISSRRIEPSHDVRALSSTFPQFPVTNTAEYLPSNGHHARIIDFYGNSRVPYQLRDWLRACGVTVQDSIRKGQIDSAACGFIAAEVIGYIYNSQTSISGLSDDEIAEANTRSAVAAGRRFFNLPANSNHWLTQTEIYRLIGQRTSLDLRQTYHITAVDTTQQFISFIFARHALELQDTGGTRYYVLNTDSAGSGFHWYIVAVTYAPKQQVINPQKRSIGDLSAGTMYIKNSDGTVSEGIQLLLIIWSHLRIPFLQVT